jgi:type IV secretion system protein TrbG
MKRFLILLSFAAVPLWGQSPSSKTMVSPANPNPAESRELTPEQKKNLAGYDFTGAIQKLSTPAAVPSSPAPQHAVSGPPPVPLLEQTAVPTISPESKVPVPSAVSPESKVPPGWKPPQTELNSTALNATSVASNWEAAFNLATPGADGRVVYMFGAGMPVLVCAPLRVCVLELERGEHIQSQPQIGDSRRWDVTPISSGTGLDETPQLIVKPIEAGLDTDLVVPTDRRTYVVRLVSDPTRYVSRVAFKYSTDDHAQWAAFQAREDARKRDAELAAEQAAAAQKEKDKKDGVVEMTINPADKLYFDYKIEGDPNLVPQRVLDDGQHTYIFYPNNQRFRELPTLIILVNGKGELVNFRVDGNKYVVDRLFDKAFLIVGVGNKQSRVKITRIDHYIEE